MLDELTKVRIAKATEAGVRRAQRKQKRSRHVSKSNRHNGMGAAAKLFKPINIGNHLGPTRSIWRFQCFVDSVVGKDRVRGCRRAGDAWERAGNGSR